MSIASIPSIESRDTLDPLSRVHALKEFGVYHEEAFVGSSRIEVAPRRVRELERALKGKPVHHNKMHRPPSLIKQHGAEAGLHLDFQRLGDESEASETEDDAEVVATNTKIVRYTSSQMVQMRQSEQVLVQRRDVEGNEELEMVREQIVLVHHVLCFQPWVVVL